MSDEIKNDLEVEDTTSNEKIDSISTADKIKAWLPFAFAIVYAILPVDIIPDVPVVGWFDDALFTIVGGLNGIQNSVLLGNDNLQKIVKYIKWGLLILGLLVIAVIVLIVVVIARIGTN